MTATNPLETRPCLRAQFCCQSGLTSPAGVVAAGRECAAFRLWVDGLPTAGYYALMQLRRYGFAYDLIELETQLLCALQEGPAGPLARIVGQRVLDLLSTNHDAACFFLEEEGIG